MAKTAFDQKNRYKIVLRLFSFLCVDFRFFRDFNHFLRPCEALRQVKKQLIKVKFWVAFLTVHM